MVGFNIFEVAEKERPHVEAWPENWPVFELFCKLQTQWRQGGMGGPCGLDYNVLLSLLERQRLNDADFDQTIANIQVMEFAALEAMNQKE